MGRVKDNRLYRVMVENASKPGKPVKMAGDMTFSRAMDFQKGRIWSYLSNARTQLVLRMVGDYAETGHMNSIEVKQDPGTSFESHSVYWIEEDV